MDSKEIGEINVIPLVDIMLVLLTIVLTTATFIVAGEISVSMPEAKNVDRASLNPFSITLTGEERLFMGSKEISRDELIETIKRLDPQTPVVIRADESVPVRTFVFVLDSFKGAGFRNISLQVRKP